MSRIVLCSDLHLGHRNIHKFRQFAKVTFAEESEHRAWLMGELKATLQERDRVIVTGDVAFTRETLEEFKQLPGQKILVRGNHDNFSTREYLDVFSEVYGLWCWKSFWLSHAPVHPSELRGRVNLHGHVHMDTISDSRYFNLCPENLMPIFGRPWCTLDEVRYLRPRTKELEVK